MTPKVWYLIVTLGMQDYSIPVYFETEEACMHVGQTILQHGKFSKSWTPTFRCWHPGKPPVRPMGGAL